MTTSFDPPASIEVDRPSVRPSLSKLTADLLALTKPRITLMVAATAAGGMGLALRATRAVSLPTPGLSKLFMAIAGTALVVSGANALNMYLERSSDGLMARTRERPLPAGRLAPLPALVFGLTLALASIPLLTFGVNAVTGLAAAIALVTYVLVYTPAKRVTTWALPIGAVPGAIPPLLGWTAVTGSIDPPAVLLFGLLFFWQIPHFLAIATFRREDYARAGLRVLPVVKGDRVTRFHVVGYLLALLAVTSMLIKAGPSWSKVWSGEPVGGPLYPAASIGLGLVFFGLGAQGLSPRAGDAWARRLFYFSMVYLVLIFTALLVRF